MNKIIYLALMLLTTSAGAQEPADALRFSWTIPGGTARQQAIGGAMGSLGGDISASFVNPAGLAFYRTGEGVITPAFHFAKNKSSYLGRLEKDDDKKFDVGASGYVFGTGARRQKSHAFAIAFNTSGNFKQDLLYRGLNNQSSFSQQYVEELQSSATPAEAEYKFAFGSSLAYNTYLVDTIQNGTGYTYFSRAANLLSSGLFQEQKWKQRGGIYETALAFAVNDRDKWMYGFTFGIPYLYYNREASFTEADTSTNSTNEFNFFQFTEKVTTQGIGLNARLGMIYKPTEYWRLGLAFHSPTAYMLKRNDETSITTDTENYEGSWSDYSTNYTGDAPTELSFIEYTPYKAIASISYVLREIQDVTKQKGFLTADVEYINHRMASFHEEKSTENPSDPATKAYFKSLNKAIDKAYKGSFNFRAGGELKFTTIMVRAGAAYYSNPYKDINGENASRLNLSAGLGYRHKGIFVDLTYVHSMLKDVHTAYRLTSAPYAHAKIKSTTGNAFLTFGYKF